jgi:hypothetical protein
MAAKLLNLKGSAVPLKKVKRLLSMFLSVILVSTGLTVASASPEKV